MATLYGTTDGGELRPVLVLNDGTLVTDKTLGEQGPVGDKGPTGDKGETGDKGPTGDQGPVGEKGPVGDKGATGDTGDKGETGDKGATGDQGPVGDKGPTGNQGPPGEDGSVVVPAGLVCWGVQRQDWGQWLLCDGRAFDKTVYRDLYLLLDFQFGVDENGNPLLPDLRGEFIRGFDGGRGIDTDRTLFSHQMDQVGYHNHTLAIVTGDGGKDRVQMKWSGKSVSHRDDLIGYVGEEGQQTRPRNVAFNGFISTSVQDSVRALANQRKALDMASL